VEQNQVEFLFMLYLTRTSICYFTFWPSKLLITHLKTYIYIYILP